MQMALKIFDNNSKISMPVMTLDRYAKTRQGCLVQKDGALTNILSEFSVTGRLHKQFSACDNFYLSHKS